ncbi:MAG: transposase [Verrucomicrobia bacterium]|nr:transposase [Verrucomicrobiota bacterium]MDA1066260.1 transposase [Verrucomicrobiota bacterium]
MRDPSKGHAALRKGRWSAQDTMYFLTICLRTGQSGLDSKELFESSLTHLKTLEKDKCRAVHGIVHMPDHVHLLVELNTETNLQDLVRLYKGRMTPELRKNELKWENGYFDRRLRPEDSVGSVLRYMLMNPYRKGLITTDSEWPYFHCREEAKSWINIAGEKNLPMPEWIGSAGKKNINA